MLPLKVVEISTIPNFFDCHKTQVTIPASIIEIIDANIIIL